MGYKMTFSDMMNIIFNRTYLGMPEYQVPSDIGQAKTDAQKHAAKLLDCYKHNYGSGSNGIHHMNAYGLNRIAEKYPLEFAQWIADGDIPDLFVKELTIRGGSAHPLHPGTLDILLTSNIPVVLRYARWLNEIYEDKGYTR